MSILVRIIATKHQEVSAMLGSSDMDALMQQAKNRSCLGFANALRNKAQASQIGIIAEVKRASPSKGIICQNFNPVLAATGYQAAGAACLSVLTDRQYFLGHDDDLMAVRAAVTLPILRKDFMVHPSQITHAKAMGADCILLIVACLDDDTLHALHAHALSLGLDILIEIHDDNELTRALTLPKSAHNIYGINNRNLNTFEVSLETSITLSTGLFDTLGKDALVVSESGIHSSDEITRLRAHGLHHFLIGEQFMKTDDAGAALAALLAQV